MRALLLVPLSACYQYLPTPVSSVRPAADPLRIRLTEAGTSAMESQLGAGVRDIEGRLETLAGDTVVVNITQLYTAARTTLQSSGGTARIPRALIRETSVRTLNPRRTVALGIGAVAAVVTAAAVSGGTAGGTPPTPPPVTPP